MDGIGIALLREAQAAGLSVEARGDKLVVRGPKSAEPLALTLLAHKPAVMAVLRAGGDDPAPVCGWWVQGRTPHRRFWLSIHGVTVCAHCSPPAVPELVLRWLEPRAN